MIDTIPNEYIPHTVSNELYSMLYKYLNKIMTKILKGWKCFLKASISKHVFLLI